MNQQSILKEPDRWLLSLKRTKQDRTLADQKKVRNLKFRVEHANRKGRSRCQSLGVKAKETLDENFAKINPKCKLAKPSVKPTLKRDKSFLFKSWKKYDNSNLIPDPVPDPPLKKEDVFAIIAEVEE